MFKSFNNFANAIFALSAFAILMVLTFGTAEPVQAQTYPYTTPVYIPNAVIPTQTISAPATINFSTQGLGTLSLRVSGTCTSLAATLKASNDSGANYTAINLYPVATGTTAPTAVASISAAGFWKSNVAGFNQVQLNVSALTATCTVTMLGTPGGFNGTQF
jgi:hypothetical protein